MNCCPSYPGHVVGRLKVLYISTVHATWFNCMSEVRVLAVAGLTLPRPGDVVPPFACYKMLSDMVSSRLGLLEGGPAALTAPSREI